MKGRNTPQKIHTRPRKRDSGGNKGKRQKSRKEEKNKRKGVGKEDGEEQHLRARDARALMPLSLPLILPNRLLESYLSPSEPESGVCQAAGSIGRVWGALR